MRPMRTGSVIRPSGLAPCIGDQLEEPLRFSCTTWLADVGRAVTTALNAAAAAEAIIGKSILGTLDNTCCLRSWFLGGPTFYLCTADPESPPTPTIYMTYRHLPYRHTDLHLTRVRPRSIGHKTNRAGDIERSMGWWATSSFRVHGVTAYLEDDCQHSKSRVGGPLQRLHH